MTSMNPQSPFDPSPQQSQPSAPQGPPVYSQPNSVASAAFVHVEPPKTWRTIGIVFITTTVLALGVMVWALINFVDQKNNADSRISQAAALATNEAAQKAAADYEKERASSTQLFAGPEDYGRVSFSYRKDWSGYVKSDAANGGTYEAYFNPSVVPPITNDQQFALRVIIENKDYERVIDSYNSLVSKGDLKTSSIKADENNGTRLDGSFSKDVRGAAVIFKIRDKTVTIRTDAETFKGDFDALIKTITFNK